MVAVDIQSAGQGQTKHRAKVIKILKGVSQSLDYRSKNLHSAKKLCYAFMKNSVWLCVLLYRSGISASMVTEK